jgi:hypothetical protein
MKKNKLKKLVLNRETLAELDGPGLTRAAGGVVTNYTCPTVTCQPDNCDYSNGRHTCLTCDNLTCTTNFC